MSRHSTCYILFTAAKIDLQIKWISFFILYLKNFPYYIFFFRIAQFDYLLSRNSVIFALLISLAFSLIKGRETKALHTKSDNRFLSSKKTQISHQKTPQIQYQTLWIPIISSERNGQSNSRYIIITMRHRALSVKRKLAFFLMAPAASTSAAR